jgi:hypothetical protein
MAAITSNPRTVVSDIITDNMNISGYTPVINDRWFRTNIADQRQIVLRRETGTRNDNQLNHWSSPKQTMEVFRLVVHATSDTLLREMMAEIRRIFTDKAICKTNIPADIDYIMLDNNELVTMKNKKASCFADMCTYFVKVVYVE